MSKSTGTVKVVAISGEVGRYRVESWGNEEPNTVDILENNGNGECDCPQFQFRCHKAYVASRAVKGSKFIPTPYGTKGSTQCRHIAAANMSFLWRIKRALIEKQES